MSVKGMGESVLKDVRVAALAFVVALGVAMTPSVGYATDCPQGQATGCECEPLQGAGGGWLCPIDCCNSASGPTCLYEVRQLMC